MAVRLEDALASSHKRVWTPERRESSGADQLLQEAVAMANTRADFESGEGARRAGRFGQGRTFTETKAGFKTTEFVMMLAVVVAILIATYVADADLGANEGWRYISWVAVAYIVSRGLAKAGTPEPYGDRFDGDVPETRRG
jgi:hypothetical protein